MNERNMTMRERAALDEHITGHGGEDQFRDEEPEPDEIRNVTTDHALEPYTATDLFQVARAKVNKEHKENQERIVELEEELKRRHERDSELVVQINLLADLLEGPPENEVDDDDPIIKQINETAAADVPLISKIVRVMTGKPRMKATQILKELDESDFEIGLLNRWGLQQELQRHKSKFSYIKNEGWKLK